jgi:hypothetical protein
MTDKPLDTEKIILIDYDDEDALLFFKEEEPDLTEYQFHHTAIEASGEHIDVYYLKENFEKIKLFLKEKYNNKS